MKRHVEFEQMKSLIDGIDESDAPGEKVEGTDAAIGYAVDAIGDFVMDVAGGQNRLTAGRKFGFGEPALDASLVSAELNSYLGLHSKSLSAGGDDVWLHH
jgi:hypothetical protein